MVVFTIWLSRPDVFGGVADGQTVPIHSHTGIFGTPLVPNIPGAIRDLDPCNWQLVLVPNRDRHTDYKGRNRFDSGYAPCNDPHSPERL